MRPSVVAAWPAVAREHEGFLNFAYLDTVEKVTVGIGSLFDDGTGQPPAAFLALPWTTGGQSATRAQIAAGWLLVKSRTDLAPRGGYAFRDVTALRIDTQTVDRLLMVRTNQFWGILAGQLPDLEQWPADAQLALIDCAYQGGPRFLNVDKPGRAELRAAALAGDFTACAQYCANPNANAARNAARARWFRNAARVVELGLSRNVLWGDSIPEQKEDEMPLTESDLEKIREVVQEEIRLALPRMWDSDEVDTIPDGRDVIRPRTALARLLEAR